VEENTEDDSACPIRITIRSKFKVMHPTNCFAERIVLFYLFYLRALLAGCWYTRCCSSSAAALAELVEPSLYIYSADISLYGPLFSLGGDTRPRGRTPWGNPACDPAINPLL
jgi:hypothetical protein